jgi:acyl carrier protein
MMPNDIEPKVFSIVRDVFANPDLVINSETTAADVAGWDSFSHMTLVMQVEEEFGVSFETSEIGKMGRVGDLVALVRQKVGGS